MTEGSVEPVKLNRGAELVVASAGAVVAALGRVEVGFKGVNEKDVMLTLLDDVAAGAELANENKPVGLGLTADELAAGTVVGC